MSQKTGHRGGSGEGSPPPKAVGVVEERCPICLDDFRDKAFISSCFHSFCFACLVRASQVSGNTCPMCKTKFRKIIHNIRANDDYETYEVPETSSESRQQVMQDLDEAIRNFRGYRTTMHTGRVPRGVTNALATSSGGHSGNGSVLVHISLPSGSHHATTSRQSGARREREFGRNIRRSGRCAPLHVRRAVYSTGVRALPLEAGSRRLRSRIISAAHFKKNPAGTHRLGPWLAREFEVLVGEDQVEFMMQLVLSLIDKVDLESELFGAHLEPFLNERTSHFMHELISFAKSPFDIIAYDNKVRYDWPANYSVPAGHSGSSGDNRNSRTEVFERSSGQGASTNSFPGTSEYQSSMQQRIFSELVDDSDSCHIVEPSSSPIIIHGSDSDSEDESENKRSKLDLAFHEGFPGTSSLYTSSKGQSRPMGEASKSRILPQAASLPSTSGGVDEISLFVDDTNDYSDPETPGKFGQPLDSGGEAVHSSSKRSSKGKGKLGSSKSKYKNTDSLRKGLSIHRERHHSPWHKPRDSSLEEEEAEEERRYRRRKYKSRNRDEESRHAKKHKGKSASKDGRDHDRRHKERQASRSSEDRHGKKKLDKLEKHHKRRSRSYSDSEEEFSARISKRIRKHKSRRHLEWDASHVHQLLPADDSRVKKEVKDGIEEQLLMQEAKTIDDQIKSSKREILKSALKKERIELLQKMSSGEGSSVVGVASVEAAVSDMKQQVLHNELAQLNEKLVNEKRRLLKVVKHIEEEKAEHS